MSDVLAAYLAKTERPPTGRVHLHAFVRRNSLHRAAIYEDGDGSREPIRKNLVYQPHKTVLCGELDWRVVTRRTPVCDVPGRCVLADVIDGA